MKTTLNLPDLTNKKELFRIMKGNHCLSEFQLYLATLHLEKKKEKNLRAEVCEIINTYLGKGRNKFSSKTILIDIRKPQYTCLKNKT